MVVKRYIYTDGSVTATQISVNAITTEKIAANAVNADKIAASAITSAKIAANAVTSDKIVANAVTAAKIASKTITANQIAANSVTAAELSVSTLSAISANLGTVTAGVLKSTNYVANSTGSTFNLNNGYLEINNGSVNLKNSVASTKINASGFITSQFLGHTLDCTGTIFNGVTIYKTNNKSDYKIMLGNEAISIFKEESEIISGKNGAKYYKDGFDYYRNSKLVTRAGFEDNGGAFWLANSQGANTIGLIGSQGLIYGRKISADYGIPFVQWGTNWNFGSGSWKEYIITFQKSYAAPPLISVMPTTLFSNENICLTEVTETYFKYSVYEPTTSFAYGTRWMAIGVNNG